MGRTLRKVGEAATATSHQPVSRHALAANVPPASVDTVAVSRLASQPASQPQPARTERVTHILPEAAVATDGADKV